MKNSSQKNLRKWSQGMMCLATVVCVNETTPTVWGARLDLGKGEGAAKINVEPEVYLTLLASPVDEKDDSVSRVWSLLGKADNSDEWVAKADELTDEGYPSWATLAMWMAVRTEPDRGELWFRWAETMAYVGDVATARMILHEWAKRFGDTISDTQQAIRAMLSWKDIEGAGELINQQVTQGRISAVQKNDLLDLMP